MEQLCIDMNNLLKKASWYDYSRSFQSIPTPLESLAGGKEPEICSNFQGSFWWGFGVSHYFS